MSLRAALSELERLANRVLDWSDFRIVRARAGQHLMVYRGALGWDDRGDPPFDAARLRHLAIESARPVVVSDATTDDRVLAPVPRASSMLFVPLALGDEVIGTLELDHHKPYAYSQKAVAAGQTLGGQVSTAIHIADQREPLVETVDRVTAEVKSLGNTAESLRTGSAAVAETGQRKRFGMQVHAEELPARRTGLQNSAGMSARAHSSIEIAPGSPRLQRVYNLLVKYRFVMLDGHGAPLMA